MTALKRAEVDAVLAGRNTKFPIVLVYGPDAGLVRERVEALIRQSVDDPNDPFSLARLDDAALAETPTRLVEEAHTIPLFGGRRAVWVKAGTRNIMPAIEVLAAAPPGADCRVVIEAGDLRRAAPLRALAERSRDIAAIACYPDETADLARLADDDLRRAGLTLAPDARELLVSLIGGDRLAARSEIEKLALYAHGRERIEVADVVAVAADASALAGEAILDAAFAGRAQEVESQFARARAAGTRPDVITGSALRHVAQLHRARVAIDAGNDTDEAMRGMYPAPFGPRRALVTAALRQWTAAGLARAMAQLAETQFECRRRAALADALASRTLLAIAQQARRRS